MNTETYLFPMEYVTKLTEIQGNLVKLLDCETDGKNLSCFEYDKLKEIESKTDDLIHMINLRIATERKLKREGKI